jgi:hypothetical protein
MRISVWIVIQMHQDLCSLQQHCCQNLKTRALKYWSLSSMLSLYTTGLSDVPGEAMVKSYCPKCMDVYTPKSSRHHHTDGAYFGTGFPQMLFMVHPEYRPKRPANQFVPRLVQTLYRLYWQWNCSRLFSGTLQEQMQIVPSYPIYFCGKHSSCLSTLHLQKLPH